MRLQTITAQNSYLVCERVALNNLLKTTCMSNKKKLTEHQSGNEKLHSGETLNVIMTQTDRALEPMDAHTCCLLRLDKRI